MEYFSESKNEWVNVDDMHPEHAKRALKKLLQDRHSTLKVRDGDMIENVVRLCQANDTIRDVVDNLRGHI